MRAALGLLGWLGLGLALGLGGCTSLWQTSGMSGARQGVSSSLVDYLYPKGEKPPAVDEALPHLQLPLNVGLAFVPSNNPRGLSEERKTRLLNEVKQAFSDRKFIRHIEVIPDTYLAAGQGFETIDQVARLYGLDEIALVSYDQVVYSEDTAASLLYWTIIGAYVIKGSRNDVQTFVDTAVFDIPTRKLLFRAPGVDRFSNSSTLVKSGEALRAAREAGFDRAMQDMTGNLQVSLDRFVIRVKEEKVAKVSYRSGGGGGGAIDLWLLMIVALAGFGRRAYSLRRQG
ncbi:MAG: rhombotarget lipoprotein [Candidatus Thiodiazotropha sp.]